MLHSNQALKRLQELPVESDAPRTPVVREARPARTDAEATQILDQQTLSDLIDGAAFLSVGGGGPKSMGQEMAKMLANVTVPMVGVDAVADDQWVVMSAYLGSPTAAANLKTPTFDSLERSIRALEKSAGVKVSYVVPGEIGAVNSIAPILAANDLGVPVIDADGCGRAVPLIAATTFGQYNASIARSGAAVANDSDDKAQYQSAVFQAATTTQIQGNAIAVIGSPAYGLLGAIATWLITGAELKQLAVPGGLSRSIAIGAALRQSTGKQPDDVQRALEAGGIQSRYLFNGAALRPLKMEVATVQGHDQATLTLQVVGTQEIATVYMLNENILAYSSASPQPVILSPDMLAWLGTDGSTFDNSELAQKMKEKTAVDMYAVGIEATQPIGSPTLPNRMAFRDNPGILKVMQAIMEDLGYAGSYVPFQA